MADTGLLIIDTAITALAEAASTDEVLKLRGDAERAKAYAKIAKNRSMQADAAVIIQRAERRLGQMIQSAKETGQLGIGRRSKSNVLAVGPTAVGPQDQSARKDQSTNENGDSEADAEMVGGADHSSERFSLEEIGVSKDLSSRAQKWARLGEADFEANLVALRERIVSGGAKLVKQAGHNGATMAGRTEPDDSLDYFPTPPWATRTLIEDVLGANGFMLFDRTLFDPCCGEGHISGVLEEVDGATVIASDIFDYSRDGVSPAGWACAADYLQGADCPEDWIITNPPFGGRELEFILKALDEARVGVAAFVRSQWAVEGVDRYERLFRDRTPTIEAYFTERVPLVKGRWDPEANSMTAYCWLVWIKGEAPRPILRIPPGRRAARSRPDDVARFTMRPVRSLSANQSLQPDEPVDPAGAAPLSSPRQVPFPSENNDEATHGAGDRVVGEVAGVVSRASEGAGALAPVAAEGPEDEPPAGEAAAPSASPASSSPRSGQEADRPALRSGASANRSGPLTTAEQNAIIRDGVAAGRLAADLAQATGLNVETVYKRIQRMKLADPTGKRRREALAESNRRRAKPKEAAE